MSYAVTTENLTERYGDCTVVDDLSLRISEGCVYGFLGPNGAGKPTTMRMLLSLIEPSDGEVQVLGQLMTRATRRSLLGRIGSLIEAPSGYTHLTGAEDMRLIQRLLHLDDAQIEHAVQVVHLTEQMNKKVRKYSLGMKQRLGVAMALVRQPQLLILDEPTNGLDPVGIGEMHELLRHLAVNRVTVMASSHLLGEIDKIATQLGILAQGRMIFQGTRAELMKASSSNALITCSEPRRAQNLFAPYNPRLESSGDPALAGTDDKRTARFVASLVHEGIDVHGVRRDEQSLEDVLMRLTEGGGL